MIQYVKLSNSNRFNKREIELENGKYEKHTDRNQFLVTKIYSMKKRFGYNFKA